MGYLDNTGLSYFWGKLKNTFALNTTVGDLSDLDTTDKSSLVAAVNEVNGKGLPAGGTPGDVLIKTGDTDYEAYWNKIAVHMQGWVGTESSEIEADFNPSIPTPDALISNLSYGVVVTLVVNYNKNLRLISATKTNNLCNFVFAGLLDSGTLAVASFSSVSDSEEYDMTGEYTTVPIYHIPNTGIPKTDLSADVQASLNLADTALQLANITGTRSGTSVSVSFESDTPNKIYLQGGLGNPYTLKFDTVILQLVSVSGNFISGPFNFTFAGVTAENTLSVVIFSSVAKSATSMIGTLVETTIPSAFSDTPAALGTAAAGSSTAWARGDHVHAMPSASDVGAISTAHIVNSITSADISSWNNKLDDENIYIIHTEWDDSLNKTVVSEPWEDVVAAGEAGKLIYLKNEYEDPILVTYQPETEEDGEVYPPGLSWAIVGYGRGTNQVSTTRYGYYYTDEDKLVQDTRAYTAATPSAIPAASTVVGTALGTAAVGLSSAYARADHVHPIPAASTTYSSTSTEAISGKGVAAALSALSIPSTPSDIGAAPASAAVPSGGSTGQVLSKVSGTDYDVAWTTVSGGGGGGSVDYFTISSGMLCMVYEET